MTIIRASRQKQVITIRTNVVGDRSSTLFVLTVLTSWGILVNMPVTVPIQLKSCDNSMSLSPKDPNQWIQPTMCAPNILCFLNSDKPVFLFGNN
jgi:hypothetical protein